MDERLCGRIALFLSFFERSMDGGFFGFEVAETEVVSWIVIEAGRKKEDTRLRHDFEIQEFFRILFFSYSFKRRFISEIARRLKRFVESLSARN